MKTVSLPVELVSAILNTLAQRPYAEVHQLMAAIQAEVNKQAQEASKD